jgi:hypothetical protein
MYGPCDRGPVRRLARLSALACALGGSVASLAAATPAASAATTAFSCEGTAAVGLLPSDPPKGSDSKMAISSNMTTCTSHPQLGGGLAYEVVSVPALRCDADRRIELPGEKVIYWQDPPVTAGQSTVRYTTRFTMSQPFPQMAELWIQNVGSVVAGRFTGYGYFERIYGGVFPTPCQTSWGGPFRETITLTY